MHKLFSVAIFVLAFIAPFFFTLWWDRRNPRFWIMLATLIISGWMLIECEALIFKFSHDANLFEKELIPGNVVTADQAGEDHVGDVAIALFLGWVIPVAGAGVGSLLTRLNRRNGA